MSATTKRSRRLHGRRGLKLNDKIGIFADIRRRLHGRRGLKSSCRRKTASKTTSPPSRAAWIEISSEAVFEILRKGRRLHGRRGLKFCIVPCLEPLVRRRLHGRRGLKSAGALLSGTPWKSPPSRAAWIEITGLHSRLCFRAVAAFTGGVD